MPKTETPPLPMGEGRGEGCLGRAEKPLKPELDSLDSRSIFIASLRTTQGPAFLYGS